MGSNSEPELDEAIALIRRGWTQYAYARNAEGVNVDEDAPSACAWCIRGALWKAGARAEVHDAVDAAVAEVIGKPYPHEFNDTPGRTQEEVIQLLETVKERLIRGN